MGLLRLRKRKVADMKKSMFDRLISSGLAEIEDGKVRLTIKGKNVLGWLRLQKSFYD